MTVLILFVKKKYFDQIKSGEKTEEYREIKGYWTKRICGKVIEKIFICGGSHAEKRTAENTLEFPWKGYEIKTIAHEFFGENPVLVYAIKLEK
jgi:hypothetical protein